MGALEDIESASTRTVIGPRTSRIDVGGYERVAEHPFDLANAANLDSVPQRPDIYALCRMVHAEEGASPVIHKVMVAECVINRAKSRGISAYSIITYDSRRELWGFFGEQSGRYCASGGHSDPCEQDAAAVIAVANGEISIAKGAEKFFAPAIRSQRGKRIKPRNQVVLDWAEEGYQWIGPVEDLDAGELMALSFKGRGRADARPALNFFKTRFPGDSENA